MSGSVARIRPARSGDEPDAYHVCLKTGDHGQDGEPFYQEDPDALGRIYVGPYLTFAHHPDYFCPEPYEAYPSHLHIDLLPRAQGRGHGRRVLERLMDTLAQRGSPGAHLGVNGTVALRIALLAAGIQAEDEVIVLEPRLRWRCCW